MVFMKILALGDPHGELPKNLDSIIKKNKIELIICTGDYSKVKMNPDGTGFTDNNDPKRILKKFSAFCLPLLTLKGNLYNNRKSKKIFTNEIKKYKNFYYKTTGKLNILNQTFLFFDVIYEKESIPVINRRTLTIMGSYKTREPKLNKLLKENPNSILITHNPPYGVLDKAYDGKHVGSKILLKAIKKHQPKIVLCGHIHESKGKKKIGKTPVYNLGWHGDYAVIDINRNKLIDSNFLK